jgi:hypothetical protein
MQPAFVDNLFFRLHIFVFLSGKSSTAPNWKYAVEVPVVSTDTACDAHDFHAQCKFKL